MLLIEFEARLRSVLWFQRNGIELNPDRGDIVDRRIGDRDIHRTGATIAPAANALAEGQCRYSWKCDVQCASFHGLVYSVDAALFSLSNVW